MGAIWLRDLPTVLSGLDAQFYSGWENRARSTGGYDGLVGIAIHHTASNMSPDNDMSYMWKSASDRPIGAIYLGRDGRIVVGCAGATNTQGKGGPLTTSKGTVPKDKGNQYMLAVEAANTGTGEAWPTVQTDRYIALVQALCRGYGFAPDDVFGHFDYCAPSCPGRKIDPAGPSPFGYVNQSDTWDIKRFRAALTVPTPDPTPDPEEEEMSKDLLVQGQAGSLWVMPATCQFRFALDGPSFENMRATGNYQFVQMTDDQLTRIPNNVIVDAL